MIPLAIDDFRVDQMLANTERWVAINSGTRNLLGLRNMADDLANCFAILPGTLSLIDPEPVETVTNSGCIEALDHGQHLHLRVRPDAPVQMLFTGHMDTVYGTDHPFQSARWMENGTFNGPGAADMKGGLAVMLAALEAVEASHLASRIGYEVVINSDEETGSLSSNGLIASAARGKHAAFTYEPALPDGTLAGARGGTGNFSLVVRGRSAHAGRNPEQGRNALVAAADLAVRLAAAATPTLSVNPAKIEGGGPNNVVPDLAILRVNFRPRSGDVIEVARAAIERIAREVEQSHEVRVTPHGSFNRPPKPIDPGAARLFNLVRETGSMLGLDVGWKATGGVCDGNNIAACGVPVVDTMGVRGGAIHSVEEFLIPGSLSERAALSALSILRIAEQGVL
ncbi:hydrolase [Sphingomonas xinjiangensis]|uniref:Glutamate carboxypeptidase n=1 Tax=Sphingomonas xinjiangensis TaxID=643568 RepID=A0A840YN39_9SPHN|nr:hydrolase [Sphingomonas xinjiangensis]MBB5709131.1 glutamate carboxypeptidase [Sphingomonas xinjiangensis]